MRTELELPCGGGREALANEGFVAACASERGERAINNATLLLMGAGLAGLLVLEELGVIAKDQAVGLFFTGIERIQ